MKKSIGVIVLFFTFTNSISLHGMETPATSIPLVLQEQLTLIQHLAIKLYNSTGTLAIPSFCDYLCEYIVTNKLSPNVEEGKEKDKDSDASEGNIYDLIKRTHSDVSIVENSVSTKNSLCKFYYRKTQPRDPQFKSQILISQNLEEKKQEKNLLEKLTANTKLNMYKKCFFAGSVTTLACVGVIWSLPKFYHWLRP